MFIPNTTGKLFSLTGKDVYSQATYGAGVTVLCSIVKLMDKIIVTPPRSNISATPGASEEVISLSKLLFPKNVRIKFDDKFIISGISLRVTGVQERRDVMGTLDHYEVDFGMWQ